MTKEAFLTQLERALEPMDETERFRTLQYYREILEDRMEDGLSEEEAVAEMEPIEVIAAQLLRDAPRKQPPQAERSPAVIALLILGAPLWLALLIAAGALVLAVYVTVWAVVVAVFAVVAALIAAGVAGVAAPFLFGAGSLMTGLFLLGAALVCGAVGILLALPCAWFTRWLARKTGAAARRFWRWLTNRKEHTL